MNSEAMSRTARYFTTPTDHKALSGVEDQEQQGDPVKRAGRAGGWHWDPHRHGRLAYAPLESRSRSSANVGVAGPPSAPPAPQ